MMDEGYTSMYVFQISITINPFNFPIFGTSSSSKTLRNLAKIGENDKNIL